MTVEEIQEPNYNKRIQFDDVLSYAKKTKTLIDYNFLRNNGFNPMEINWVMRYRKKDIDNANKIINPRFNELEKENQELREYIKQLEGKKTSKQYHKFEKYGDDWIIKTLDLKTNKYKSSANVSKKNVVDLIKAIHFITTPDNPKTHYRQIVETLIFQKNLSITSDAFNGGKNRAKYFFPCYYYPLKILESLGIIKHKYQGVVIVKRFDVTESEL